MELPWVEGIPGCRASGGAFNAGRANAGIPNHWREAKRAVVNEVPLAAECVRHAKIQTGRAGKVPNRTSKPYSVLVPQAASSLLLAKNLVRQEYLSYANPQLVGEQSIIDY